MRITPTKEQWQALTPVERFNFRVTNSLNRSPQIRRFLTRLGSIVNTWWIELGTSKIVLDHGFDSFSRVDPQKAILLVANHRTFYDHFVISARLFRLLGPHHSIYFPVRSNFFYDNILGLFVNLIFAVSVMYPPFVRDKKRRVWNKYATDLLADLLRDPGNMVGYHPEGTRNRGSDPYSFLRSKPGCGELIYRSHPNVVPVFLQGFPPKFWEMLRRNLLGGHSAKPIVHMVMGEPMDFSEEFALEPGMKTYLLISQKVMARIEELSKREREIRARFEEEHSGEGDPMKEFATEPSHRG